MFDQAAYMKAWNKRNAAKVKAYKAAWHKRKMQDPEYRAKMKLNRELRHFGVPLSVILRKNDGKCHFCGKVATLGHHLDEDGRTNERKGLPPSHDLSRIVPACHRCHIDLHRAKLMSFRRTKRNGFWSLKYDKCVRCGRTDRRHNSRGLCSTCVRWVKRRERKAPIRQTKHPQPNPTR